MSHIWHVWFCCGAQGQGVLSDKLRSFSMQDLTLINADDDLSLHTSDPRMRRDPMDEMSSGASTLPRAKSTAARQSKATRHTHTPTPLYWQLHTVTHICMNTYIQYILCKVSLRGLPLFMSRTETGRAKWSHVIFKALQDGRGRGRSVELGVKACDSSRRGGT